MHLAYPELKFPANYQTLVSSNVNTKRTYRRDYGRRECIHIKVFRDFKDDVYIKTV